MSFTEAVRSCLTKYATFSGRARRSEYWWFYLATTIAWFVGILLLALVAGVLAAFLPESASNAIAIVAVLLFVVMAIGLTLPSLAVLVRRLHDAGHSGWWFFIGFVPFGSLVLLVFACMDSVPDNKYGPSPKPQHGYPGQPYAGGPSGYGQQSPPYGPSSNGQQSYGSPSHGQQSYGPPPYGQQPESGPGQTPG